MHDLICLPELSTIIANTKMYDEWLSNKTGLYNGSTYVSDDLHLHNGTVLEYGILSVSSYC